MFTAIARHAARLLFAAILGFVPSLAHAQVCNPTSPQLDPGTGFAAFGPNEQLLVRGGNSGPAWEWALGSDTEAGPLSKGSLDWTPGRTLQWTLSYSGAGSATIQVRDQGNLVLSLSHPSGMDAGNALQFQVATNPSIGADTSIGATVTSINGMAVSGSLAQTGNNQQTAQSLYYFYPPMQQGFSASGTVTLNYPAGELPGGSRVDFLVRAGTIACQYTNQAPTVSLTAPGSGTVFTAPANITVSANAADSDGTVTQVEFYQGATLIGTATTAPYSINWTNVAVGTYSLTAKATDNQGATTTSAPVSVIVNSPPSVSLTSPASGATYNAPATVNLAASASDTDGTIAKVDFYQGATLIGTATSAPYSFAWINVAAGNYTLTARATDDRGAVTISATVSIAINAPPTVSITAPANNAVYQAPANITLSAQASDADGTIARVDFYQGTSLIGGASAAPFSISWTNVAAGVYSVTAVATDNSGASTTSSPVTVQVNVAPTVSLTNPVNNATFTSPATIDLAATAADTDGTIVKVEFLQGTSLLATVTVAPYTYTWGNVQPGSYSLSARATDDLGATTTSSPVAVTVSAPAPQVYYIHPDHLNTPRLIADAAGTTVWRWDQQEPFGNDTPNGDPNSTGTTFDFPLRFPGQYYDRETNLAYNVMRDYDPAIGRYVEPDPLGTATTWPGAPTTGLNHLYIYANGRPLQLIDPLGLAPLPGYNYCGPGNNAGLPPVNCVDGACKEHDECYNACGVSAGTRWLPNNIAKGCAVKCDWKLVQDYKVCKVKELCQPPRSSPPSLPPAP